MRNWQCESQDFIVPVVGNRVSSVKSSSSVMRLLTIMTITMTTTVEGFVVTTKISTEKRKMVNPCCLPTTTRVPSAKSPSPLVLSSSSSSSSFMDPVTYLRTEWVSAALCTNQTPRSADVCLQLGTQDGRAVTFLPRTIRELITSSVEADGQIPLSVQRQLKQNQERRQIVEQMKISYLNQRADNLVETPSESVDVVISLQATEKMVQNGMDWQQSVREAVRVLKPGGRLLWVEPTFVQGQAYIEFIESLVVEEDDDEQQEETDSKNEGDDDDESNSNSASFPLFEDIGYDEIDWILQPHTAGVAIKRTFTPKEQVEQEKLMEQQKQAELSLQAFERGSKKKKRRKTKAAAEESKKQ